MSQPTPPPRTRFRRWLVLPAAALLLAGAFVPGSPLHWANWWPTADAKGRSLGRLTRGLAHADPDVRMESAQALGRLNATAAPAVPELAGAMRGDAHPGVRAAAAEALAKMAPASRAVVAELAAALRDPEPLVRMNAARALLSLKAEARPAVPELIEAGTDEDNDTNVEMFTFTVRQAALRALGHAAEGSPAAVPTFSAALAGSASDPVRAIAAHGLGLAGPHARDAAPLLRALLSDPNRDVRLAAEEALARIGADRDGPVHRGEFDGLELPEAERERIWDIEHRGNVLNASGFAPLADALARSDAPALLAFLAPDFAASVPGAEPPARAGGVVAAERSRGPDAPAVPLAGAPFVARLIELRKACGPGATVKLVVATLRPKAADKPAGPWEGRALLRVYGETAPGAPAEVTAALDYEVAAPAEPALAAGGWLRAAHIRQWTATRAPHYLFAETAKARGLDTALHDNWTADATVVTTGGVYVTDFDRDGHLDALVTDVTGHALYRGGPGGRFADVTRAVGLPRRPAPAATAAAWVDLDGDGWDDLILDGRVYRNAAGAFEDVTARCSLRVPLDLTAILAADYDRDGRLDLYFTRTGRPGNMSWLEGRTSDAKGNRLYRNRGDWTFEDVTKKTGTRGGGRSTFAAAWLDADGDGWPDLYVPNEFGDGVLLVNGRDGTFKPRPLAGRTSDFGTMGLAAGDVDNDGRIDIYSANMYSKAGTRVIGNMRPDAYPPKVMEKLRRFVAGSQLHLNKGDLTFDPVGAEKQLAAVGWAYGAALADLDGDGFLDVYATAGYISRDRDKPDG